MSKSVTLTMLSKYRNNVKSKNMIGDNVKKFRKKKGLTRGISAVKIPTRKIAKKKYFTPRLSTESCFGKLQKREIHPRREISILV